MMLANTLARWLGKILVVAGFSVALAGCRIGPDAEGRPGRNVELSLGSSQPAAPTDTAPAAAPRTGSNLAPPQEAAAAPPTSGPDKQALSAMFDQIQALGETSPEEQARLLEDLKNTDPTVWPMLLQYTRVAAARRRAIDAPPAAEPRAGSQIARRDTTPGWAPQRPETAGVADPRAAAPAPSSSPQLAALAASAAPIEPARADLIPAVVPGNPANTVAVAPSSVAPVQVAAQPVLAERAPVISSAPAAFSAAPSPASAAATSPAIAAAPTSTGVVLASHNAALPGDWKSQLASTIRAAEQQAKDGIPADAEREAQLRMLYLLAGRKDDALRPIPGASDSQQAFWSNELFGLAALLDADRNPDGARRAADAVGHLEQAQAKLRESGALVVRNLAFCTEVRSYGITKPFDVYQFAPGQEVLLYAELENFRIQATPKGHQTAFHSRYEILNAEGRVVAEHEFPPTEEFCRNPRRDFFIRYFLRLPEESLADGKYTLRLKLEDTLGKKSGESTIGFTVKKS